MTPTEEQALRFRQANDGLLQSIRSLAEAMPNTAENRSLVAALVTLSRHFKDQETS